MPAAARRRATTARPAAEPTPPQAVAETTPAGGPAPAPAVTETTCPFHGRDIRVTIPTAEQLLVLTRLVDRFAPGEDGAGPTFRNAEQAMAALNRMLNAVTSMIVDDGDVEFVEDLMGAKRATMEEVAGFAKAALDLLAKANPAATTPQPGKRARLVLR